MTTPELIGGMLDAHLDVAIVDTPTHPSGGNGRQLIRLRNTTTGGQT
jgi:hypothetical protein